MAGITGTAGELNERLVDLLDRPGPHLRAVTTTLLIKALDLPAEEMGLMEAMVASDDAAAMIDPTAAAAAGVRLRHRLISRLGELAGDYGEPAVVGTMRDHLLGQLQRWATRAVDDAENRRRAERFLAWAERPGQLEAAQRRGLFAGMSADDFRRLAEQRVGAPVSPETAVDIWSQVEVWSTLAEEAVGDSVVAEWTVAAQPREAGG